MTQNAKLTIAQREALEGALRYGDAYPQERTRRVLIRLGYAEKVGPDYGMRITEAGRKALIESA